MDWLTVEYGDLEWKNDKIILGIQFSLKLHYFKPETENLKS